MPPVPVVPGHTSYTLTLRPAPGPWHAAPDQRLKGLLKVAVWAFGFRCEVCRPAEGVEPAKQPEAAKPPHAETEKPMQ